MIKNFDIKKEKFREWDFEKFEPYTFQIRDIARRCKPIIGNLTEQQAQNFIKTADGEMEEFCKLKNIDPFLIYTYPTIEHFFEYLRNLNNNQKVRNRRKQNIFAKQAAYYSIKSLDYAIDMIREGNLRLASRTIQGSEESIRFAESLNQANNKGKESREKRTDDLEIKQFKHKIQEIVNNYLTDEKTGIIKYYAGSRRATAKHLLSTGPDSKKPYHITKEEVSLLGSRAEKTLEGWIKEIEGLRMDACY